MATEMMSRILAIDPGTEKSAWVQVDESGRPALGGIDLNHDVLELFAAFHGVVVIEMVQSFGMPIGAEVLTTVWWTGRFWQEAEREKCLVAGLGRKEIVTHLCGTPRGKDANVRQALLDRWGGKRTKENPAGLPRWVVKDVWSALAVATVAMDRGLAKQEVGKW